LSFFNSVEEHAGPIEKPIQPVIPASNRDAKKITRTREPDHLLIVQDWQWNSPAFFTARAATRIRHRGSAADLRHDRNEVIMKPASIFTAWRLGSAVALFMVLMAPGALQATGNDTYDENKEEVKLPHRSLDLWCAKPKNPRSPTFLVIFASGDGGMHGGSKATYKHMAEQGHYVAAFSSRDALKRVKSTGQLGTFPEAAAAVAALMREAKRLLGLPESTPTVVSGVSRGASFVVFAAGEPSLQPNISGAVAIALTRESDYMKPPDPADRGASIKLDEKGGILLYPALDRLGSIPIAVIQSTNDNYVPSAESRRLMGPDTPTRRLYEVQASNHSFGGGQDQMLRDVDEALDWIAATIKAPGATAK
jgi:hypothetical protein